MTPYEKRIMRGVKPFWAKHYYLMKLAFVIYLITTPVWYPFLAMWAMRDELVDTVKEAWGEVKL